MYDLERKCVLKSIQTSKIIICKLPSLLKYRIIFIIQQKEPKQLELGVTKWIRQCIGRFRRIRQYCNHISGTFYYLYASLLLQLLQTSFKYIVYWLFKNRGECERNLSPLNYVVVFMWNRTLSFLVSKIGLTCYAPHFPLTPPTEICELSF